MIFDYSYLTFSITVYNFHCSEFLAYLGIMDDIIKVTENETDYGGARKQRYNYDSQY